MCFLNIEFAKQYPGDSIYKSNNVKSRITF